MYYYKNVLIQQVTLDILSGVSFNNHRLQKEAARIEINIDMSFTNH